MKNLFYFAIFATLFLSSCNDDNGPTPPPTPTPVMNYLTETPVTLCGNPSVYGIISDVYDQNNDGSDDIILYEANSYEDEIIACFLSGTSGSRDLYDNDFASSGHTIIEGNSGGSIWNTKSCYLTLYDVYRHLQYYDYCNGPQAYDSEWKTTQLAVGDFDGDNNAEYAYGQYENYPYSSTTQETYENFVESQDNLSIPDFTQFLSSNATWTDMKINRAADLNNDGFDDFIYSPENVYGDVRIRYGSSSGLGAENQLIPVVSSPSQNKKVISFDFIDLEGDGDLDGVAVFDDNTVGFIENFGTATSADFLGGNLEPTIHDLDDVFPSLTLQQYTSVGIMDYDLDGNSTDLLLTTTSNALVVFEDQ